MESGWDKAKKDLLAQPAPLGKLDLYPACPYPGPVCENKETSLRSAIPRGLAISAQNVSPAQEVFL